MCCCLQGWAWAVACMVLSVLERVRGGRHAGVWGACCGAAWRLRGGGQAQVCRGEGSGRHVQWGCGMVVMHHIMLRPLALGGRTPCRPRLRHKHPRCRRLAAARPRLSLTSTRGPARSLADRLGKPLLPTHRSPLSDGALEEDAEDIARRRRPNSDSTSAKDSNRCRAVGADGPQHDSKRAAACVEVLERAARSRSGSPTRWRREP